MQLFIMKKKIASELEDANNYYANVQLSCFFCRIFSYYTLLTLFLCPFTKQVIEEVRRVLMVDTVERQDFLRKCGSRLTEEIEFLVYYGIDSKGLNPPRSPHLSKFLSCAVSYLYVIQNTVLLY